MEFIERLTRFLRRLDERELQRLIGIVLGSITLLLALLMYFYFSTTWNLQRRLQDINQKRKETQSILAKYDIVMQQQKKVDELLKADPTFRIKHFFTVTLQELDLTGRLKKEPEVSSQDLVTGYRALKLDAQLTNLSMKQLVGLLDKIERNERVYIKEVTITPAKQSQALEIILTIATFEAIAGP